MARAKTHYFFASGAIRFLITPRDQNGLVRLYLGDTPTQESLGEFSSVREAFQAICEQRTGYHPWDSIDSKQACAEAKEVSRWRQIGIGCLADERDRISQHDEPEEIPPPGQL
jgi:hypothetical protein